MDGDPAEGVIVNNVPAGLPVSWSTAEVCAALHVSPRKVAALIREGKVSYYLAGRSKRFLSEHVAQIVAALEVKPVPAVKSVPNLGLSPQSAARRRRSVE